MTKSTIRRYFSCLVLVAALALNGCSEKLAPLGPETVESSNVQNLEFISLKKADNALGKDVLMEATEYITYEQGGLLEVNYSDGEITAKTSFRVLARTISQDSWLSLKIDETLLSGNVDVEFAPHGVEFSTPAILNIEIRNADLSNIDPDRLGLYYTSSEDGLWEKMQVGKIYVNKQMGMLFIFNARIPHFSRYALAHSE